MLHGLLINFYLCTYIRSHYRLQYMSMSKQLLLFKEKPVSNTIVDESKFQVYDPKFIEIEEEELNRLARDMSEIKEITMTLSTMIGEQNEQLDKVEENIEESTVTVVKAGGEVEKALKNKKSGYKMGFGATSGAVVGSFFGPLGALTGAGVGFIVGGVTTLIS